MDYYRKSAKDVMGQLCTSSEGLSSSGVSSRLKQYGSNAIHEDEDMSKLMLFFSQFNDFIVQILIGAAVVSLLLSEWADGIVILIILLLNALLGFIQEYKAEEAINALRRLIPLKAIVIRNGKEQEIDTHEIVPGDIIVLTTGEKIPADGYLLEASNLEIMAAVLTGESVPERKHAGILKNKTSLADRYNSVYSGTVITKGRGKAVVTATGMNTEFGKIAASIKNIEPKKTPLQETLQHFGFKLGLIIIAICLIVFGAGVLRGGELFEMFLAAVSLAVAAVPEGLPAVVTITLAIGVKRMISHNALVRKLPSVETLGSTSVICSDKTGTLTHNQMTVKKVYVDGKVINVSGSGYSTRGEFDRKTSSLKTMLAIGLLCNDAYVESDTVIGDPTEAALTISAAKLDIKKGDYNRRYPRVAELPFDSKRKMMSTVHEVNNKRIQYTKGSPLEILKRCSRIKENGKVRYLNRNDYEKIQQANDDFAKHALRVLAFAYREADKKPVESNMVFVGLQGMIDPPREEVKEAIKRCKNAGIKVVMITGDQRETARAIAHQIGITGKVVLGDDIKYMPHFNKEVENIGIFARVSPVHKMQIVHALQDNGHVVAMTGDGVNDAPSLKKADIGIAMGISGTDVAKEASHMILTDDNFASIVNAVEEGRGIFDNIQKFVEYLLSCNIGEVLTIFIGILLGFPLPLVAIQILWMNLVTDGFPALSLAMEPHEAGIMNRKPQDKEEIMEKGMYIRILITGLIMMTGTLGIFWWYQDAGDQYSRTVAFTTLVFFQFFQVLNCRSKRHSFFSMGFFTNKWVWPAIALSVLLQLAVIYSPIAAFFYTVPLVLYDWGFILLLSSSLFISREIWKFFSS